MTDLEKELLAALKVALRTWVPAVPPHDPNRHYFDQIKAAIKKAES